MGVAAQTAAEAADGLGFGGAVAPYRPACRVGVELIGHIVAAVTHSAVGGAAEWVETRIKRDQVRAEEPAAYCHAAGAVHLRGREWQIGAKADRCCGNGALRPGDSRGNKQSDRGKSE
jgi:hypothetical protein